MQHSDRRDGEKRVIPFPGTEPDSLRLQHIFREHKGRLVQYMRIRLRSETEAEDAAQMAFLRLHTRRDTLHTQNIEALLYVTARNIATDLLRQRSRRGTGHDELSLDFIENIADNTAGAERVLAAKQDVKLIMKILEELPDKCRQGFISYRFQELDYSEIAERMDVTESMVRKYVLKATAHCARRFDELEGWE